MGQFLPATPYTDMADTPRGTGYLHNLSREEVETLMQLGGLNVTQLIGEVIIIIIILITMIDDVMTSVCNSAANRLIGEVVQSRRRPLLGPSPG